MSDIQWYMDEAVSYDQFSVTEILRVYIEQAYIDSAYISLPLLQICHRKLYLDLKMTVFLHPLSPGPRIHPSRVELMLIYPIIEVEIS